MRRASTRSSRPRGESVSDGTRPKPAGWRYRLLHLPSVSPGSLNSSRHPSQRPPRTGRPPAYRETPQPGRWPGLALFFVRLLRKGRYRGGPECRRSVDHQRERPMDQRREEGCLLPGITAGNALCLSLKRPRKGGHFCGQDGNLGEWTPHAPSRPPVVQDERIADLLDPQVVVRVAGDQFQAILQQRFGKGLETRDFLT